MNKTTIIIVAVIIAGVFFYGGMKYDQSKAPVASGFRMGQGTGMGRGLRGGPNGGFVGGQIISKDATSLTISDQNGGSKIIFFTNTTPIQKPTTGTLSDLTTGEQISVVGTTNTDGSITAESIQIRPATTTRVK